MNQLELYKAFGTDDEFGKNVRTLLAQTHWFSINVEFDPKTGEALPQALSTFLAKITEDNSDGVVRDRLWRIIEHSRASVKRLFRSLNESPRREQALLPIHAVRELDVNSFIKLSNRPGRNVREKLAGKPYLQAVRRFQSIDLPENRLLKAFVNRLEELLVLRRDNLKHEDELLSVIQSWMHTDEAQAIARWDNSPPNNTLLSHRDYRRVLDAWRWLQTLDDDINRDFLKLEKRDKMMHQWISYAQMWAEGGHHFAEMPVLFDYDEFEIKSWLSKVVVQKSSQKINRHLFAQEILEPACIDLTVLRPCFATTSKGAQALSDSFLWQNWENDSESVDINLFLSDAACLRDDAILISVCDLFFSNDKTLEYFDRAARSFVSRLGESFKDDALIWLVPDSLNDFELEVLRRNLNFRFPNAEPLPRSIAAIFERVDYSNYIRNGYAVVIVDFVGDKICATKLVAKFDEDLKKRLPRTKGFYWERCPPVTLSDTKQDEPQNNRHDIFTVDAQEQWHDATRPVKQVSIKETVLKRDPRIGKFNDCISLIESPVTGGAILRDLQQRAGDIPLWRDQIPELSIKVMKAGLYQRFHLVSRGTTVKPIRGQSVSIKIADNFTLPARKRHYAFPLYIGDNADDLGFSARLDSPAFPLKKNTTCKLNLTFEYGANEPYKLVFIPLDKSLPPVRATWRRTEEEIITDALSPEYPTPMTWAELQLVQRPGSDETSDLLDWTLRAIELINQDIYSYPKPRMNGVIDSYWRSDKNGDYYTFATCKSTYESVFIHQDNFIIGLSYTDFTEGDKISFELQERDGKYSGYKVARPGYKDKVRLKDFGKKTTKNVVGRFHKSFYFPVIQIWREGRSIDNPECPKKFAKAMHQGINFLASLLQHDGIPDSIKYEILFLMSCMHKDAHVKCVEWVINQVEKWEIHDLRAVGFALGDVSEQWQKDVLKQLISRPRSDALRIFAYAIWREQHFIKKFTILELKSILSALNKMLDNIKRHLPRKNQKDKWIARKWARAIAEPLELLLGLLRTRNSSDPEIKMLLQPHQKITKELAQQVERVANIVAESNVSLFSRVQINIQKPEGDRTPDLLYALRLYLTGDDGANTIHIAGVSDTDED